MAKRFLQIVAVLVAALLCAQPALAGLNCTMGAPASIPCAPDCGMAMSQMGMDCQTPLQVAGTGCFQNCCQQGLPQVVAQLTAGAKPKASGTKILLMTPTVAPAAEMALVVTPPGDIVSGTPPRYILFRAFRI
ncbi:MAG: hypothetical protein ABR923_06560 [Terracidiphilus sp.]|jgi:hypothetical protein